MKDKDEGNGIENSATVKAKKKPVKAGANRREKRGKRNEGTSIEAPTAKGKGKEKKEMNENNCKNHWH